MADAVTSAEYVSNDSPILTVLYTIQERQPRSLVLSFPDIGVPPLRQPVARVATPNQRSKSKRVPATSHVNIVTQYAQVRK
jgi:hypothetical protein